MTLYSFESPSGVETIFEIGVTVGAPKKAEGVSEAFGVNHSIIDRPQKQKKRIS
jgi:hypothetical protein